VGHTITVFRVVTTAKTIDVRQKRQFNPQTAEPNERNSDMQRMIRFGLALALVSAAWLPMAAEARGGGAQVTKSGKCAPHTTWKLKLSKDDGRIEADFEVDQNRVGRDWKVTLKDNGNRFFRGIRTTQAPSGSFEVRKFTSNVPGTDRIVAKARNLRSGVLCKGVARI
jgi:hypothetical protein